MSQSILIHLCTQGYAAILSWDTWMRYMNDPYDKTQQKSHKLACKKYKSGERDNLLCVYSISHPNICIISNIQHWYTAEDSGHADSAAGAGAGAAYMYV